MNERVRTNRDIGQAPRVRTVARPLQSAAQPVNPVMRGGPSLADALSGLMPSLNKYVSDYQAKREEDEDNRAYDTIQGMTYEEAQAKVASGELRKTESPFFQAAFKKQFGQLHAEQRRREIVDQYNNGFDKVNGNLDEFLADFAAADHEQYGEDKHIMAGLREGMAGFFPTVKNQHAESTSTRTQGQAADGFVGVARGAIERAADGDVGAALAPIYKDHQAALGIAPEALDGNLMTLAAEYAEQGNVAAVNGILNSTFTGDGTVPLRERAEFTLAATELANRAQAKAGETFRMTHTQTILDMQQHAQNGALTPEHQGILATLVETDVMSQGQRESIMTQNLTAQTRRASEAATAALRSDVLDVATDAIVGGKGWMIRDVQVPQLDGGVKTFTADEIKEAVAGEQIAALEASGASIGTISTQIASWGIGYTHSPWESTMSHGIGALIPALAQDPAAPIPEPAMAGYALWRELGNDPNLRNAHVSDPKAAEIYRDAELLETIAGIPVDEALRRSASINRAGNRASLATTLNRNDFESAINRATSGGFFSGRVDNQGYVGQQIEGLARVYMDLQMGPKDALKAATQAFKDSHTNINGMSINTRDARLPANIEEIADTLLDQFATETGENKRDLTLAPDVLNSDYWMVVYKGEIVTPVFGVDGTKVRYHVSELNPDALRGGLTMQDVVNQRIAERNGVTLTTE